MSQHSLKRIPFLSILAILLAAPAVFAANPSARFRTPLEYDSSTHRAVLFGGATGVDSATKISYELHDTWEWASGQWNQRFPAHSPSGRAGHILVDDTARKRLVLFGGHAGKLDFNDTWFYKNGDWTQINTPDAPSVRQLAGAAYDPIRDRIVLFGGSQLSPDLKTTATLRDTWEFDGTTWRQILSDGPNVSKPLLAYDVAHHQIVMLGIDDKFATLMYTYDPSTVSWKQVTPATLPSCVDEGMLTYHSGDDALFYTGGVCTGSAATEDTYEWDGTTWNKIALTAFAGRVFGAGLTYVPEVGSAVLYGGASVAGVPRRNTFLYNDKAWLEINDSHDPAPRSLPAFVADPLHQAIWMVGGVDDGGVLLDFWQYQNGTWSVLPTDGGPTTCSYPNAAWDSDRQKLVVLCDTSETFEWDGAAWKSFTPKTSPTGRRFSSMVYDANLKKTVLFGGFNTNYSDETWTWDGTTWTRQSHNPPPSRALTAMWYDPTLKRTVIYGGIGRLTSQDVLTRYSDMWSFDGNGWTEIKPAGGTPGARYGAQVAVDPRTGKLELFGGLRLDVNGTAQTQAYDNGTWEFDGTAWTKIVTDGSPEARENGGMAYDWSRREMVLFGGYSGQYYSDVWTLNIVASPGAADTGIWRVRNETFSRRRAGRK